ncbi:RadC family protein [Candidatus Avelusimicrobium aviculae]|uniref:RadC family protein n=1 Tax=Candidatus Avelusimicrobium aviculae TaxID=3416206 RepID=UPI003D11BB58
MKPKEKPSYLGHRERIRGKFAEGGLAPFLDHEVLELLLTYAIARRDTKPLAWALLKRFGSLSGVLDASPQELKSVKGIGPNTAVFIKLVREVFKRYALEAVRETVTIRTPEQVAQYCKASLEGKSEECLELIYLSVRNTVTKAEIIATGLIDRVSVSPRKIVECALAAKAAAVILVHNHPSGDATPSVEDILLTREVVDAARLLGISVYDHIIVGKGTHYSLRANGKI